MAVRLCPQHGTRESGSGAFSLPDASLFSSMDTLLSSLHPDVVCAEETSSVDVEVVVIGNGPAGLSLSVFLSGWQPYYDVNCPHPDPQLHARLSRHAEQSLLDQDLCWFEEEFAETINPNVRPVAHLVDALMRPPNGISCLRYVQNPGKAISHLVLGDTEVGGSWNAYDDEMITVSLASWLDLPAFSICDWLQGEPLIARLPAAMIREYLREYARRMNLTDYMRPRTTVTSVNKVQDTVTGEDVFEVSGLDKDGNAFALRCRKVIFACGQSHLRNLEIEGELAHDNIVYDVATMKKTLQEHPELGQRVILVGDGISAADALMHCTKNGIPVLHVMRRSDMQLRTTMLSKLSASVYPEYVRAYKLMIGKEQNDFYSKLTRSTVVKVEDSVATLQTAEGSLKEPFTLMVACIGRRSDLPMLPGKVEFAADYRCFSDRSMFAVGSLAGDHFIRYLIGGCLQVASTLLSEHDCEVKERRVKLLQEQMNKRLRAVEQRQKRLRRKPAGGRCCIISRILSTTS